MWRILMVLLVGLVWATPIAAQTIVDATDIPCAQQPFKLYATSTGSSALPCKYDSTDKAYESMAYSFADESINYHSVMLTLGCSTSRTYFVRCDGDTLALVPLNMGVRITFDVLAEPPSDITPPLIAITGPTSAATWNNYAVSTVTLSGTASDASGVAGVTWSCPRCPTTSGTATGTTPTWSAPSMALGVGASVITVTATDSSSNHNTAADTITVTYYPVAQGALRSNGGVLLRGTRAN